jgi:hypothetical protein
MWKFYSSAVIYGVLCAFLIVFALRWFMTPQNVTVAREESLGAPRQFVAEFDGVRLYRVFDGERYIYIATKGDHVAIGR